MSFTRVATVLAMVCSRTTLDRREFVDLKRPPVFIYFSYSFAQGGDGQ